MTLAVLYIQVLGGVDGKTLSCTVFDCSLDACPWLGSVTDPTTIGVVSCGLWQLWPCSPHSSCVIPAAGEIVISGIPDLLDGEFLSFRSQGPQRCGTAEYLCSGLFLYWRNHSQSTSTMMEKMPTRVANAAPGSTSASVRSKVGVVLGMSLTIVAATLGTGERFAAKSRTSVKPGVMAYKTSTVVVIENDQGVISADLSFTPIGTLVEAETDVI